MVAEIILVAQSAAPDEASRQNAQYVARGLGVLGYKVREQISVCENMRQLQQAVAAGVSRSNALLILGGLGPRFDHMAKTVIAQGLRLPLEENAEALAGMRAYCQRCGEAMTLEDEELARLPQGAVAFPGEYGKIPGFVISSSAQHIILLPETPEEIAAMFSGQVAPYLGGRASTTVTRTVRTYGVSERQVRELLAPVATASNPAVSIRSEQGEVVVEVTAGAETSQQAASLCTPVLRNIVDLLGDAAYGLDVDSLQSALVGKLNKKELDIALAESGTGGLLARLFSETPGGQSLLRFSTLADGEAAKAKLGASAKLLKKRGEVSEYTAVAMAAAARERVHAGIGVAVTAATEEYADRNTPAGLVYIAVCDAEYAYIKKLVVGDGGVADDAVVDAAVSRALNMARLFVDYQPGRYPGAVPLMSVLDGKTTVTDRESYEEVGVGFAALAADGLNDREPQRAEKARGGREKGGKTKKEKKNREAKGKENMAKSAGKNPGGKKKKSRRKAMRHAVFILALCVFLSSASYIGYIVYQSYAAKKQAELLNEMFTYGEMDLENIEVPDDYPEDYQLKFVGLWSINPDVRAFVRIPDTPINYPIVQAPEEKEPEKKNDYYLRRDFYEDSNQYGVPFFDFRVDVEKPSDNMMVYGHNMDTSGRFLDVKMFGEIVKYKELDYYKEHPTIDFSTVYQDGKYKIFSIFITNAYQNQGHVFDYYNFIDAEDDEQYAEFLHQLKARSIIDTAVDVEPGDHLITLSTCSYEFKDMRTVVVARRVRDGESEDVNTADAKNNPNPLYPDVVYRNWGGTKPDGIDSYWTVGQNASSYIGYEGDATAPVASAPPPEERIEAPHASSAASSSTPASSGTAPSSQPSSSSTSEESRDSTAEWLASRAQSRREQEEREEAEARRQSNLDEWSRQQQEQPASSSSDPAPSQPSEPTPSQPSEPTPSEPSSASEPAFEPQPEGSGARADDPGASESAQQVSNEEGGATG